MPLTSMKNVLPIIYLLDIKFADYGKGDKDTFRGELKNGKKEGFGMYIFKNNDLHIGYWNNDKMHGMGTYLYDDINNSERYLYIG